MKIERIEAKTVNERNEFNVVTGYRAFATTYYSYKDYLGNVRKGTYHSKSKVEANKEYEVVYSTRNTYKHYILRKGRIRDRIIAGAQALTCTLILLAELYNKQLPGAYLALINIVLLCIGNKAMNED